MKGESSPELFLPFELPLEGEDLPAQQAFHVPSRYPRPPDGDGGEEGKGRKGEFSTQGRLPIPRRPYPEAREEPHRL